VMVYANGSFSGLSLTGSTEKGLPKLTDGVPVTNLAGVPGQGLIYEITIPAGTQTLAFQTAGGSGQSILFAKFGSAPNPNSTAAGSYDCRIYNGNTAGVCTYQSPAAGTYYVIVYAYGSFSGLSLTGSTEKTLPKLTNKVAQTGLAGAPGQGLLYQITVPAGAQTLSFQTSGGTGQSILFSKSGTAPNPNSTATGSYDCRMYNGNTTGICTYTAPAAGTYFVMVYAYGSISGESLTASY